MRGQIKLANQRPRPAGFISLKPGFIIGFLVGLAAGIFVGMVLSILLAGESTDIDQLQNVQQQAEQAADRVEQTQDQASGIAEEVNQIIDRVNPDEEVPN